MILGEIGVLENNRILIMRNNKIFTGQPTHTQRGFYPTQRGFWLISRAPSGFKLGLETDEKVSHTTHKQAHTRGSTKGLNKGQDLNQRLS